MGDRPKACSHGDEDGQDLPHGATAEDARCERCGRCCFEKIIVGDEVIILPIPCRHLDLETNECKVYDRRHDLQLRCLSVEDGIRARTFPADCPYVRDLPDYNPPLEPHEVEDLEELIDAWREAQGLKTKEHGHDHDD